MFWISGWVLKDFNLADVATISVKSAFEPNYACVAFETGHRQEFMRIAVEVCIWHNENLTKIGSDSNTSNFLIIVSEFNLCNEFLFNEHLVQLDCLLLNLIIILQCLNLVLLTHFFLARNHYWPYADETWEGVAP